MFVFLAGARGYVTQQQSAVLLPADDDPTVGIEQDVGAEGVVTRARAVRAPSARLDAPVNVAIASVEQSVPAGTELFYVSVDGDAAWQLGTRPEAWCAPRKVDAGLAMHAVLDTAAFGLLRGLNRSSAFSVYCFVDRDGDGRFDAVFLSGAKRDADIVPVPVDPLPATITRDQPLDGVAEGRIVFVGSIDREGDDIGFRFETASAGGKPVQQELRASLKVRKLPAEVEIQGAHLTVLAYDPVRRSVRVRLDQPMAPGGYRFTPPARYIYVPVFMPR